MKAVINIRFSLFIVVALTIGNIKLTQAQQLSLQWAQKFGHTGWDYINEIKQTEEGNYILAGSFKGNLPEDSLNLKTELSSNAWIASCDTNGSVLWQKTFGGREFETTTSIAKTPQGILIAGMYQDTIRFDSLELISSAYTSAFTALINENGESVWLRQTGGKATISNFLISSNETGVCFIAGSFRDSLELAGNLRASVGESGLFLTQLLPNGNELNPIVFKGTGASSLGGISCNDSLVCIAGSFSDTLRFADTLILPLGEEDTFIAVFNHSGQLRWIQTAGSIGATKVTAIALAKNSEVGFTGNYNFTSLFGQQIIESNGGRDMYITVLNPDGRFKWANSIGGISNDYGYAIYVNDLNEYFVSGSFVHTIGIPDENGEIVEMESFSPFGNAFIAKYNNAGILKASYNLPGTSEDYCKSLTVNEEGMITAVGNFYETLQLEGENGQITELVSSGKKDMFILRFRDMCKDFTVEAGVDTLLCPEQSIYLSPSESYTTYQWLPGGIKNHDLEVTQPGVYSLTATSMYGCIATDSLLVELAPLPVAFAGKDTIAEAGTLVLLNQGIVTEADELYWNTNGEGYFGNNYELNTNYSMSNSDISEGSVILSLTATNMCASVADSLIVTIPMDDDGITAFPNPTAGLVTLVCEDNMIIQTVTITKQSGFVIESGITVNNTEFTYNLQTQAPGTYLFYLTTNVSVVTKVINKL